MRVCMNIIQSLSKSELLQTTVSLVAEERRLTLRLIDHLREIERRMLFAELGYPSLWEFCVKHLGLSEGAAHRRIAAMRLACEVPEIKPALESGRLSLSNAATLQGFFRQEKKRGKARSNPEKLEIIQSISGLSRRECEQKLSEISPQALPEERQRTLAHGQVELRLVLSQEAAENLERLKSLLAHRLPGASAADLISVLLEEKLAEIEKEKSGSGKKAKEPQAQPPSRTPRTIPAATRREVWRRAKGQCEFQVSEQTQATSLSQRRCGSRHALEIDHITPLAQGGTHALTNLRLLCS